MKKDHSFLLTGNGGPRIISGIIVPLVYVEGKPYYRMDKDTLITKKAFEEALEKFKRERIKGVINEQHNS